MKLFKTLVSTAVLVGFSTGATLAANIFVVGGKPDDPFWSIVKRGAEDAGKVVEAQGGKVTWLGPQNYDNLGVDAAELIRQAIDQKADAIVGPDWVPEAMDPAFKAVRDAGIPLLIYNAGGLKAADRLGAMNYVGSDDYKGGVAAGEYLAKGGNKKGVCINTLPGAANIEAFCGGFKEGMTNGGGEADVLPLPATSFGSATAVAQAVKAYLLQHQDVNAVFTIGNVDANSAMNGLTQAGKVGKVQLCGMNFDETILNNIKDGKQACAIDQQGYLQGYLAVAILNGHVNYGLSVPTREILTGPGIIDKANVDATIAGVKAGTR
ncbi:sugar ABC transporter substrate-binding protein [Mesorhizobium sp. B2-3-3]|uniref:sugar ABC transporter substrate-binding protein n=1 Tax=unclassified Mesorhizobium TaxID=325217 RepID=UPI00112BE7F8|nr:MULTISPECIES: sugar ABC transporter substrate-binding protein [unclassified Mesorhizobium]TPK74727.1 sugar ABC transporter substrate-binding protein [Mesorhizobium sp. B2-4-15]TPM22507.1 sugar ABC transporter substrate-binding protein [Mesorhizobium sp. B2-3-5]TPN22281.1 sugar ABC transporter substrate-binding protein [Mesorhizobium sp. B2-3-3]